MKNVNILYSLLVLLLVGCSESVTETVTYKINEPIFMPAATFRSSVKVLPEAQAIKTIGKMCFYKGYLYISEPEKGIHIVDNRVPSNPRIVGFIDLLGNADLSVRNEMLYADSFIDLVWFDIANPALPELKGRLENVFTKALPVVSDNNYGIDYAACYSAEGKGVIVGWELVEKTEDFADYSGGGWWVWRNQELMVNPTTAINANSSGATGSMSRFSIYNDNLYTVIDNYMTIFDLTGTAPLKVSESLYIGRNVETIFSYEDNMFMGTPTGLLIYSVKDPLKPEFQSSISHVFGCDPVVVENDLAYVTVHSGNFCGQTDNELIILNVADTRNPKQIVSYSMKSPKGLGIDNGKLFLCDEGLKVFQVTDPQKLMSGMVAHFSGMNGFDVIPFNNILMMMAEDGLYQYDYTTLNQITQISKITIGK